MCTKKDLSSVSMNKVSMSRVSMSRVSVNKVVAIAVGLLYFLLLPQSAFAQSGSINWNGWTFDYEVGVEHDGLAIMKVKFQGDKILERGSFPAMPVYYEDNQCGPYLDLLDQDLEPVPWANNALVVSREFRINGERWYELGIRQFVGQYDIYQVWYFNGDGVIDAHLFSRGLQCQVFHEHYPHWRFDFDIDGGANDQILYQTSSGLKKIYREFNSYATRAQNHDWRVRDSETRSYVKLSLDTGRWNVAGTIIPETAYNKNRVAGRRYQDGEERWGRGGDLYSSPDDWNDGRGQIHYGNNERINKKDIVLWYSGYLPHTASEGESLWHSTGVRITWFPSGGGSTPTPTATPPPTGQTTYKFDFGTSSSPLQSGWTRVTPSTSNSIFSRSGAGIDSRDRGGTGGVNDINRDFVFGSGRTTLNFNVGNGTWRVTMNMGDRTHAHDNMVVKAEGETINSDVDNAAGQFPYVGRGSSGGNRSFDVVVNDGVLNIELSDGGGNNQHWVLNRVQLERVD